MQFKLTLFFVFVALLPIIPFIQIGTKFITSSMNIWFSENMGLALDLSEEIIRTYYNEKKENCVEGVIITLYVDKAYIQNAYGDFMTHSKCLNEYALALSMLPHI